MVKSVKFRKKAKLSEKLETTGAEITQVKFDLIREFISLARQENEAVHLDDALAVLSAMTQSLSMESTVHDHVILQSEIAATFLRIGRKTNDQKILVKAKHAHRSAITLASISGNDALREELRKNYRFTLSLLGDKPKNVSLFKVA